MGKKTILNNEIASLKVCYEIVAKMNIDNQSMFKDPEFGP